MSDFIYDVTEQFKDLLFQLKTEHTGLTIDYFYPVKFSGKPCISYKLASSTVLNKTTLKEPRRQEVNYTVDFWGKSPATLTSLLNDLKDILIPAGYTCTFEQDLKSLDDEYYHKATRFQIIFDNKLKIVL